MDPNLCNMRNVTLNFQLENEASYDITLRLPEQQQEVDQHDIDEIKFQLRKFTELVSFKHNNVIISIQHINCQVLDGSLTEPAESFKSSDLAVFLEYVYLRNLNEDLGNSDHQVLESPTKGLQEAALGSLRADSKKITNTLIVDENSQDHQFSDFDPSLITSLEFIDLIVYVKPYIFVLRVSGYSEDKSEIKNIFHKVAENFAVDFNC